jgi:hypothetical protein
MLGVSFGRLKMSASKKNKKQFTILALIVFSLAMSVPTWADTNWLEKQKLLASDGAAGDWFGVSACISGDYAILGAPFDDGKEASSKSGSAYIFKRSGETWRQQAKIHASDSEPNDQFGTSVSISGDFAIIGAFHDSNMTGSAYIFKRDGTKWVQKDKLLASDAAVEDWFGYSVSISGDYAIVGAPYDDDKGISGGSAYIFRRDGKTWKQQAKILADDGAEYDQLGISISISGDFAIVGAWGDDNYTGSAYIFKRDGMKWIQQQKLVAKECFAGDRFGISVSNSGDLAMAGAYYDEDKGFRSGSAYIFKCDGKSWVQQQKLHAKDGSVGNVFGWSVSVGEDSAIVGAPHASYIGAAYIFKRDGKSWVQQQKILPADGVPADLFGRSVSIVAKFAVVGSFAHDIKGNDSGAAYIFKRE